MKNATLKQAKKLLEIVPDDMPSSQLQKVLASGLLTDVLNSNVDGADRNEVRIALGYKPWGVVYQRPRINSYRWKHDDCFSQKEKCFYKATIEVYGATTDGKREIIFNSCENSYCLTYAEKSVRREIKEKSPQESIKDTAHLLTLAVTDCSGNCRACRVLVKKSSEGEIKFPSGRIIFLNDLIQNDLSRPLTALEVLELSQIPGCAQDDKGGFMSYYPDYK